MDERRKHRRYTISYPIEGEGHGDNFPIILRDISEGGLAFTSDRHIKENDKLHLKVYLKNRMVVIEAIAVYGEKVKQNMYRIGAKFVTASKDFCKLLEKEIEEITQLRRENNLYNNKNLSFEEASRKYLENLTSTTD